MITLSKSRLWTLLVIFNMILGLTGVSADFDGGIYPTYIGPSLPPFTFDLCDGSTTNVYLCPVTACRPGPAGIACRDYFKKDGNYYYMDNNFCIADCAGSETDCGYGMIGCQDTCNGDIEAKFDPSAQCPPGFDNALTGGCRDVFYKGTASERHAYRGITCAGCRDADYDGRYDYDAQNCPTGTDCHDKDASIYKGAPELIDGKDNQCPGDPGYGTVDEIPCACSGTSCNPLNNGQKCDGCNYVAAPAEVCGDGLDNDCDGVADDGCCIPSGTDNTCNNVDEDCDGTKDEHYVPTATNCGVGACARTGMKTCVTGIEQDSCVVGTPAPAEICGNSIDDDCDGSTNEGCLLCTPNTACQNTLADGEVCADKYDNDCNCIDTPYDNCPSSCNVGSSCTTRGGCPGRYDQLCNCIDVQGDGCPGKDWCVLNGHKETDYSEECDNQDFGTVTSCYGFNGGFGSLRCDTNCHINCLSGCSLSGDCAYCPSGSGYKGGAGCYENDKCTKPCGQVARFEVNATYVSVQKKLAIYKGKPVTVNVVAWN
jgi:hypothetical protein